MTPAQGWRLLVAVGVLGSPGLGAAPQGALIRAEMARLHLPGLGVAVVRDGRRVWSGYFGQADLENGIPVTRRTVFRFASASKPMTAVAALRLVARGRLKLDAPIREGLGSEAGAVGEFTTLRHLLAHQSGLRHYQPRPGEEPLRHFARLAEALRERAQDPPLFVPGSGFGYSTHGYLVIGRLMERVEGRAFEEWMDRDLFKPSGMSTARVEDAHALIPHRARGYFWSLKGEWRNSAPADLSDRIPGGGLCGTVGDLAAFAAAVQSHRLLSPELTEAMWTPQRLPDGTPTGYGLGWYLADWEGRREAYHPGTQSQVSSLIYLQPDHGLGIVFLGNGEQASFLPLARRLARMWDSPARRMAAF